MITSYAHENGRLVTQPTLHSSGSAIIWVDLDNPSPAEIKLVESHYDIEIPSPDDMREIEVSSRLYQEGAAHFMTASIVYRIETQDPQSSEVTFILMPETVVTVRFSTPRAFVLFANHAEAGDIACGTPTAIVIGLVEAIVEREADLIERLQAQSEIISRQIFEANSRSHKTTQARRHSVSLKAIGRTGIITSRTRESLVSLGRFLTYFRNISQRSGTDPAVEQRIKTTQHDVRSLAAHMDHLNSRLTFLMDATIGLVGIEQNQIIKMFSVVAVMLMPPTLIASVYGMNFVHMPELQVVWAYPAAIIAMIVSSVLPFLYFRRKGWL